MEEIKKRLLDLITELEEKELQLAETSKLTEQKIAGLKTREQSLTSREESLQVNLTDLEMREKELQSEIKVDRERKEQLDIDRKQVDQEKERIKKYLNI